MRKRGELFAPAVVLTGRQLAGRGRGQHAWWSNAGCITVTFVLPIEELIAPHQLPLLAGMAVRAAAAAVTGIEQIQLKWPNDLLFDFRKLGGLLCERVEGVDLVGLGLNVNLNPSAAPPALRDRVTSLSHIAGRAFDPTDVLIAVAAELHQTLMRSGGRAFTEVLREYDAHHALVGRMVRVVGPDATSVAGRCEGLDSMGRLLLRSRSKLHRVIAGEVVL